MEVSIDALWSRNKDRAWVKFLHDEFVSGSQGKDFDTIRWWIQQFKKGETTELQGDSGLLVADGNHRLVAAKLAGLSVVSFKVVPF